MFHTILFDIDGVMLSEERYFDASALTVYELLCSPQYMNLQFPGFRHFQPGIAEDEIRTIRAAVFADDEVLHVMKRCGVNANWDMVYLQTAFQLTAVMDQLQRAGYDLSLIRSSVKDGWTAQALHYVGEYVRQCHQAIDIDFAQYVQASMACQTKDDLFRWSEARLSDLFGGDVTPFRAHRSLWQVGQQCFQEWYLGDEYVSNPGQGGKKGFLMDEVPVVPPRELAGLFQTCIDRGIHIGIGTGRPDIETRVPLEAMGWWPYFDAAAVSTASDVLQAEQQMPTHAPLSKPHPFTYLRSFLRESNTHTVLEHPLPLSPCQAESVLVVGDSVADGLAAQALGCRFAAVLTGLEGEAARAQFEALGADYILADVLAVKDIIS